MCCWNWTTYHKLQNLHNNSVVPWQVVRGLLWLMIANKRNKARQTTVQFCYINIDFPLTTRFQYGSGPWVLYGRAGCSLTDWLIDWLAENGVWFEPNSSKSNCNHLLLVPFLSGALMALALLADPRLTGHWSGRDRAEFRRALCKPSPWTNQGPETPVNWLRQSRTH